MKLKGFTDSQDWHWRTLVAMLADPKTWECGATWREWAFDASYTWYDGPIFQVRIGPFWAALITH